MEAGEQLEEQRDLSKVPKQLQPHVFQKGKSGNPSGRPKGVKSLKQFAKEYLESLPDDEKLTYMEGMDKKIIWEMAEGKAESKTESKVEVTMPKPLLNDVLKHDSPTEDSETKEED